MSETGSSDYLTSEAQARTEMDKQLEASGWVVQNHKSAAVMGAHGVAVREVPTASGPADYVLYVDGQAVGIIEAKKAGSTLTGVEYQTRKYLASYPRNYQRLGPTVRLWHLVTNRPATKPVSQPRWTPCLLVEGFPPFIGPKHSPAGTTTTQPSAPQFAGRDLASTRLTLMWCRRLRLG